VSPRIPDCTRDDLLAASGVHSKQTLTPCSRLRYRSTSMRHLTIRTDSRSCRVEFISEMARPVYAAEVSMKLVMDEGHRVLRAIILMLGDLCGGCLLERVQQAVSSPDRSVAVSRSPYVNRPYRRLRCGGGVA